MVHPVLRMTFAAASLAAALTPTTAQAGEEVLKFAPPQGYTMVEKHDVDGFLYMRWLPEGQDADNWQEAFVVSINNNIPGGEAEPLVEAWMQGRTLDTCAQANTAMMHSGRENGYTVALGLSRCMTSPEVAEYYTMIKGIAGGDGFFTVQKIWRYKPAEAEISDWIGNMTRPYLCIDGAQEHACRD